MKTFIVTIVCMHINSCPIKEKLVSPLPAPSKENCEGAVKQIIDTYGYNECGTIGCIGGWAEVVGGFTFPKFKYGKDLDTPLFQLFFPAPYICIFCKPVQAARALRNYLTYGDADWKSVMKEEVE